MGPLQESTKKEVIKPQEFTIKKIEHSRQEQNQFHPYKILNYMDKLKDLSEGKNITPVTVEIDPTNVCNHDCVWCISKEPRKNNDTHTLEKLKDIVCQLKAFGVESVVYKGGGDPLAYKYINEIIEHTKEIGLKIGLETNGGPMTLNHILTFVKCLDWVRVSLDAATNKTHWIIHQGRRQDEHERICKHIQDLASQRNAQGSSLTIGINMSIHTQNYHEIISTCRLSSELGADYISLRCVMPLYVPPAEEKMLDYIEEAFSQAKKMDFGQLKVLGYYSRHKGKPYKKCLATPLSSVIGADGEVYICCHQRGFKNYSFGNILDRSYAEIWNGERRKKVLDHVAEHHCSLDVCGDRLDHYNTIVNYLSDEVKLHKEFI